MHKLLIAAVLSLFATIANAAQVYVEAGLHRQRQRLLPLCCD